MRNLLKLVIIASFFILNAGTQVLAAEDEKPSTSTESNATSIATNDTSTSNATSTSSTNSTTNEETSVNTNTATNEPTTTSTKTVKDDMQVYYLYDDIDLATTLKYQYPKPRSVIKAVYPLLHSENNLETTNKFNKLVLDLVKAETDQFVKRINELAPVQSKLPKANVKNDLVIDYNSSFINSGQEHILSIRFSIEGMLTGLAHGYHYHRVLNYDLDSGDVIELADLFMSDANYLQYLSDYTRNALQKRLVNKDMLLAGTEPKPENFKIWNLKPTGLVITFEEYQVAPYVYGAQTVIIPYPALKDIIDPESAIDDCMKHSTRCVRNNLLTGGFIDEAINTRHSRFNPIFS